MRKKSLSGWAEELSSCSIIQVFRETNGKTRSTSRFRFYRHFALHRYSNHIANNGKTQACSSLAAACGKKRVENLADIFRANADAIIAYSQNKLRRII